MVGSLRLLWQNKLEKSILIDELCVAGLLESSDQTEALRGFQEVVKMEPDKAEW